MASIIKKPLKSGAVSWQVFVSVKGFPRISATFETRETAEEFGREQEAELKRRTLAAKPPALVRRPMAGDLLKQSLADLLAKHLVNGPCSPRYKHNVKPVVGLVGNARVGDLDEHWVRDYIAKAATTNSAHGKPFAGSTIRDHFMIMREAVRLEAMALRVERPRIPFHKSMLPKGWRVRRKRRLLRQEEKALMRALGQLRGPRNRHWRLMVRLALATGARLQELVRAEWRHVVCDFGQEANWENPRLEGPRFCWTIPANHCKTRQERPVPLGRRARRVVRCLQLLADPQSERVFHTMGSPPSCSQQFAKICARAGVKDFHFHDLRHEAISRMYIYERHLDERHISVIVGHTSREQTFEYVAMRADDFAMRMR
ncbi:site-specific integrase [Burkholderia glumae]|uniref:site-specific integrase n=1 Tax=Burkholderia glumae TaxID=337 RepID=UPI0018862764|nr:site-specific integrase [Burkholderia glumae]